MNAQEKAALQDFLQEMNRVRLERKDLEADALIRQAVQQQPDALYLLTQRALLQEQALQSAQAQIADLQNQIKDLQQSAQNPSGSSFLDSSLQWGRSGNALGSAAPAWPAPGAASASAAQQAPYQAQAQAQPQAPWSAPASGLPAARPGLLSGGGGTFLGSMAGVLAGAAAGNFLFQGIEHMLHRNEPPLGSQNLGDLNASQGSGMSSDNSLARDAGLDDVAASSREPQALEDTGAGQDSWPDSADGDDFLDGDDYA